MALFVGVGLLPRRWFGLRAVTLEDALRSFWMGFALVLLLLLLWNFVLPVDGIAMGAVMALGAAGLIQSRRDFAIDRRDVVRLALILIPIGLWMANISLEPLQSYDDGLYHLQGIRWAEEHRAIPGLANLFGPLGFNNTSFLYAALLEVGPWEDRGYHVANGLLVFALVAQSISAGLVLLRADGRERPRHVFDLVLLAPAIGFVQPDGTGSYTTGLPATLAALAALSAWFATTTDHLWPGRPEPSESPEDPLRRGWLVVSVGTLLAAAVCLKQNAAVIAATALPMAFVSWWRLWRPSKALLQRAMRYAAVLTLGIGLSWAARGVVLTGYPLFPQTIAGMPVAWRVPLAHAEAELAYAVHSARTDTGELDLPGANRPFSWLSEWWTSPTPKLFEMWVPLVLGLIGLVVYLVARPRAPPGWSGTAGPGRWMLGPIVVATVTWFVVAPAPRYGTFLIWAAAGLAVAEALRMIAAGAAARQERGKLCAPEIVGALFLLGMSPALIQPALVPGEADDGVIQAVVRANLNRPGNPLIPGLPPSPKLSVFVTESGLELLVPERRCIAAPLPCTPNPAPNLEQRNLGLLGTGFVVRGEWRMENFPYWWRPDFLPSWLRWRERGRAARS